MRYNVDALNIKWKVISFEQRNKKEKKKESFCKSFGKVKLVIVNIRLRFDISMLVMVTNPGIRFGA